MKGEIDEDAHPAGKDEFGQIDAHPAAARHDLVPHPARGILMPYKDGNDDGGQDAEQPAAAAQPLLHGIKSVVLRPEVHIKGISVEYGNKAEQGIAGKQHPENFVTKSAVEVGAQKFEHQAAPPTRLRKYPSRSSSFSRTRRSSTPPACRARASSPIFTFS